MGGGLLAVLTAGGCGVAGGQAAPQITPTVPAASDRPTPGGPVTRTCGSDYAEDFDSGVESRTVTAGPVSVVAARVSPVPGAGSPVRTFKLAVRLDAGSAAALSTSTAGTALIYDRASFRKSNVYRLADGDRSLRFVGCRDRSAVFNGAILTTGPRTVDLEVVTAGRRIPVTVTAFRS